MKLERPKWPENKKCSAMITINLNAELFWLQLDPTCKDMPKTLSLGPYLKNSGRTLNPRNIFYSGMGSGAVSR